MSAGTMNWNDLFAARTRQMKRTAVREMLKLMSQPDMISFAGGLPAPELFPIREIREASEAVFIKVGPSALQYGETEGLAGLRDWIAARHSQPGLNLTRNNVLIVSGAQQALDLIGRVFLNEGDKVIVENPTYLALLSAWRPLGVDFVAVPSDESGIQVDQLEALLPQQPKLIYSIPNFQNPHGTTLSLDRRRKLAALVRERNIVLLEDDPYGELRFEGDPLPCVFDLNARLSADGKLDGNVLYVGTFSKVLMPGLRVGWVIAPEVVTEKIVQAKQAVDLHTSTLCQWIVWELIRGGVLDRQIPLLRRVYRERRDAMLAAMQEHFPSEVTWTRPAGGMFLMATLPRGLDAGDVLSRAIQHKVAFVPGGEFHVAEGLNTMRLNFSNACPERIQEGVRRLASTLKQMIVGLAEHTAVVGSHVP